MQSPIKYFAAVNEFPSLQEAMKYQELYGFKIDNKPKAL
jgi:hypothetical protein